MTRWTSGDNQLAAAGRTVALVTFVDLDIVNDRLRAHDNVGTINWGGNDWLGVGQFGGIDAVTESLEIIAQPVKLTLSGVDPELITDAMQTQYHGRDVVIYVGLRDTETGALIDTPEEIWSGFMDVMTIEFDVNAASITIDCEHRLRRQPITSRYTDEDQRARFPDDDFFNKLHLIPAFIGKWGTRDLHFGGGHSTEGSLGGKLREHDSS
jgi:hypothetical protein